MRIARTLILTCMAMPIAACANITGTPRSVMPPDRLQQVATSGDYEVETALANFYSIDADDREGMSRQDYRDMVAGLYLAAADANYQRFRSALGSSSRGSALGFDTLSLLLTGLSASSTGSRAEDLATAATALTGFRTSFDRNLLFDRTIPAIIASMDAERARTRAGIAERLRLDAAQYPLPQFFADVQAYELSATLERAISRVNETASADRADANADLDNVLRGCDVDEDIVDELDAFRQIVLVDDDVQASANVALVAGNLGIEVPAAASALDGFRMISQELRRSQCRRGARAARIEVLTGLIAGQQDGDE